MIIRRSQSSTPLIGIPNRAVAVTVSLLLLFLSPLVVSGVVAAGRAVFSASIYQKYENTTVGISFNYPRYLDLKAEEIPANEYSGPKLSVGRDYSDIDSWTQYDTLSFRSRPVNYIKLELTDYRNIEYNSGIEDPDSGNLDYDTSLIYRPFLQEYRERQRKGAVYRTTYPTTMSLGYISYVESQAYIDGQEALLITYSIEPDTDYTYKEVQKYFYVYNEDYQVEVAVWYLADNDRAAQQADDFINSIRLPQL
jgi:hypothetical protein